MANPLHVGLRRAPGLWLHVEFRKLWAAQTVSQFGSQVTLLALPLTAVVFVQATPLQMSILTAAERVPAVAVGLFAGVLIDRVRRRPVLIWTDIGRAILLASIPVAALLGVLRMEQLYIVGLLVGMLTLLFDVAHMSFLPSLLPRAYLLEGNSKLAATRSMAETTGPGIAGALVQQIGAPLAVLVDAATFLLSAMAILRIRSDESASIVANQARGSMRTEVGEGLRFLLSDPLQRAMAGFSATFNLFGQMIAALYFLYVSRDLGVSASMLGLVLAVYGLSAFTGSLLAGRLSSRFGIDRVLVGAALLAGCANMLIPLASGPGVVTRLGFLIAAQVLIGGAGTLIGVNLVSLRQTITPGNLLGRINAADRFVVWSTLPVGALLGGVVAELAGVRVAILVGALGSLAAATWVAVIPTQYWRQRSAFAPTSP